MCTWLHTTVQRPAQILATRRLPGHLSPRPAWRGPCSSAAMRVETGRIARGATLLSITIALVAGACGGDHPEPGIRCSQCRAFRCDENLACVDCLNDGDCSAPNAPFCLRGRCGECRTDVDCGGLRSRCSPTDLQCHYPCTSKQGCTDGPTVCDLATGVCLGCASDADCTAPTSICDPTAKRCVECTTKADCTGGARLCDIPNGRCVECVTDAECATGLFTGSSNTSHVCQSGTCVSFTCRHPESGCLSL